MLDKLLEKLEPGDAVASMGYPDIIFPEERLAEHLGERVAALRYRTDSEEICKRHGVPFHAVPDAESLFEQFGCTLDVYDIVKDRGCEIVLDLNEPYPANSREQYDWVLDAGTLEHCFNVAQAAKNMAGMVKVGGQILHENPWNWGNHAFYSLHPTWFHDFYSANGFEVLTCRLTDKEHKQSPEMGPWRFVYESHEVALLTVACRREAKPFVWPTQSKYQEKK